MYSEKKLTPTTLSTRRRQVVTLWQQLIDSHSTMATTRRQMSSRLGALGTPSSRWGPNRAKHRVTFLDYILSLRPPTFSL